MKAQGEREMNTFQTNVNRRIIDLRFELDDCKEFRNFHRMAEIRLEIARLQGILRTQKNLQDAT
jgi:ribosomal protein L29